MNKLIIADKEYKGLVNKICREITLSGWIPDYIVGITRGGLLPAVMISQYFNIKMNSLDISLRDGGSCVSNCGMSSDAFGHVVYDPITSSNGRNNILIVDDINDTGATINWLMDDWRSTCLPDDPRWNDEIWNHNVKFAVVVDNLSSQCKIDIDYVGMEINKAEKDVWIEFPYEEWWTK
jgi:xanthine phosphoribosyltransferase